MGDTGFRVSLTPVIHRRFVESVKEYESAKADGSIDFIDQQEWTEKFLTFAKLFYNASLESN